MRTLCLGEAIVDLVCERPVDDLAHADAFAPHFGGAVANVAVTAARHGAPVALAGGAGDDAWGRWLLERMRDAGVELDYFELVPGCATPVAFVTTDADGEPSYAIYGDGIEATVRSLAPRLEQAVDACDACFFGSNTLVGADERGLTMAARERALAGGRPVVFDPNLRLHRWATPATAAEAARACIPDALLVRTNRDEAELLTGERDPDRAARALVRAGAGTAIVTLGADGALARGAIEADVPGVAADVLSTVGAGDVLLGVLVARLTLAAYDPEAVVEGLPIAVRESARATERWGAVA